MHAPHVWVHNDGSRIAKISDDFAPVAEVDAFESNHWDEAKHIVSEVEVLRHPVNGETLDTPQSLHHDHLFAWKQTSSSMYYYTADPFCKFSNVLQNNNSATCFVDLTAINQ